MGNILIFDVETAGGFGAPKVYDCGGCVMDTATGYIQHRFHYGVLEVLGNPQLMATAYYGWKMPKYWQSVYERKTVPMPFADVLRKLTATVDFYDIEAIAAYNAGFDMRAMRSTCEWLYENSNWMNRDVKVWDIWGGACSNICNTEKFFKWAERNGYISEAGNPKTSAEVVFQYITGKPAFEEEHIGLADSEIEAAILHSVLRRKRKADLTIRPNPWQEVGNKYKASRA